MRRVLIALAVFFVGVAFPAAQTAYYPPAGARGSGGNIIFVSPSHDLVVVWRWSAQSNEGLRRVVAAITS